ncbi:MAG TPA: FliI/YscN family ATPase [Planctomycetes bacterium]|nr:FliI/YscN family ATPase [Planctomycetota bacterium]
MSSLLTTLKSIATTDNARLTGTVSRVTGLVAEARGLALPVGSFCRILPRSSGVEPIEAEVIGFDDERTLLVPFERLEGVSPGDPVLFEGEEPMVGVSEGLLGRVIDGRGRPIDHKGPLGCEECWPIDGRPVPAMVRQRVDSPIQTGVRAIDSLLTVGRGQRLGIFAGSGVGKSMLLGMIARSTSIPIRVIALVGERGREVRDFIERDLGPAGMERTVVVVATSDDPPVLRLRAAKVATSIAEWFRSRGDDVLLLMDSITRVALAQRELGLSANEPPTTRAFPPSVFSLLPRLLERAGPGEKGSITSFYTVLVEGDDEQDPIGDAVRGFLDGHIWLSRRWANRGHYPAIDVVSSVSRVMPDIIDVDHKMAARETVADLARCAEAHDLVQLGAYVRGVDLRTDAALDRLPQIEALLRQEADESTRFEDSVRQLREIQAPEPRTTRGGL